MMPEGLSFSLRVSLRRSEKFFGPGVASLLRLVERTGSLQTAAAEMQMSYSKAWKIIRKAEGELGFPLMERRVGGAGGGSSSVSAGGKRFLERYERFRQEVQDAAQRLFTECFEGGDTNETD